MLVNNLQLLSATWSLAGDLFTAEFADCHFDETVFPSLGGDNNKNVQQERHELSWSVPTLSHLDPQLNIQNVVDSMPNAFSDIDKVTRSNTQAAHMPARLYIP